MKMITKKMRSCLTSLTFAPFLLVFVILVGVPGPATSQPSDNDKGNVEDSDQHTRCDDHQAARIVARELRRIEDFPETMSILPPNINALFYNLVMREPHEPPPSHRIYYGSVLLQFGDLRLPRGRGPFPVAVVIHGGGWQSSVNLHYMASIAASLTCAGIATWNIEYRRVGSGGEWPGLFRDVAAATDFLRELALRYPLDVSQGVVAIGHSAGGHLALWLAMRHLLSSESDLFTPDPMPIRGAVSLDGVPDLFGLAHDYPTSYAVTFQTLFGSDGAPPEVVDQRMMDADPASHLPLGVRQLLLQGNPGGSPAYGCCRIFEYVAEAHKLGDDIQFVVLDPAHHFESVDPNNRQSGPVVRRTVRSMLGLRGADE